MTTALTTIMWAIAAVAASAGYCAAGVAFYGRAKRDLEDVMLVAPNSGVPLAAAILWPVAGPAVAAAAAAYRRTDLYVEARHLRLDERERKADEELAEVLDEDETDRMRAAGLLDDGAEGDDEGGGDEPAPLPPFAGDVVHDPDDAEPDDPESGDDRDRVRDYRSKTRAPSLEQKERMVSVDGDEGGAPDTEEAAEAMERARRSFSEMGVSASGPEEREGSDDGTTWKFAPQSNILDSPAPPGGGPEDVEIHESRGAAEARRGDVEIDGDDPPPPDELVPDLVDDAPDHLPPGAPRMTGRTETGEPAEPGGDHELAYRSDDGFHCTRCGGKLPDPSRPIEGDPSNPWRAGGWRSSTHGMVLRCPCGREWERRKVAGLWRWSGWGDSTPYDPAVAYWTDTYEVQDDRERQEEGPWSLY